MIAVGERVLVEVLQTRIEKENKVTIIIPGKESKTDEKVFKNKSFIVSIGEGITSTALKVDDEVVISPHAMTNPVEVKCIESTKDKYHGIIAMYYADIICKI